MSGKKVLVLGGTGAMGVYLVPLLASQEYEVTVVSLDDVKSGDPRITYIKADAYDRAFLEELLKEKFDAIVDFMVEANSPVSGGAQNRPSAAMIRGEQ